MTRDDASDGLAGVREEAIDLLKMCGDCFEMAARVSRADPAIANEVRALCERAGYGAVMTTASALWRDMLGGLAGGEFSVICRSTAEAMVARIDTALTQPKPVVSEPMPVGVEAAVELLTGPLDRMPHAILAAVAFNEGCHRTTADAIEAGDYAGRRIDAAIAVAAIAEVQRAALAQTTPVEEAVEQMREVCAKVASDYQSDDCQAGDCNAFAREIASAISSLSQPKPSEAGGANASDEGVG